jgi:hypothetical protein
MDHHSITSVMSRLEHVLEDVDAIPRHAHSVLRWKKMGEDGKLPPKPTRVTVGYLLDATETQILRVQVAKPNGRNVDWCAAIVPLEQREEEAVTWEDVTGQGRLTA